MAYIAKVPVGNHVYLYECEGYRENGKVKSRRISIGKIDSKTGLPVYKPEYIERMETAGTPLKIRDDVPQFSMNDVKSSTIKEFGLTELLDNLAQKSGLRDCLNRSNPKHCDEIFTIAKHLAASGEPFMHCQEWLENVDISENVGNLSSQKISKILADIDSENVESFFQEWAKKRSETEYLALDITSTSSYSEQINDVEWGFNRDGENLAQVNLCMLMGEQSRLPVYQTVYQGSLRDVSTLKTTLAKFSAITEEKAILAVMDKGFYSKSNVDDLLADDNKFVISVPFSSSFAKKQVENYRDKIDDFSNSLVIGGDSLRVVTQKCEWGEKVVYSHVIYNPITAVTNREKLYKKVADMLIIATNNPEKHSSNKDICKYINISKSDADYTVEVNKEGVEAAYKHAGWLVIISNHIENAAEALRIYRAKDVVEKGFMKVKNSLDLARLRVHSDTAMQSKVFICFIALVLLSNIHNVMADKDLYRTYTLKQLTRILSKRRVQKIGGQRIEFPLTKEQRNIYQAFGFSTVLL